ncbi:hypothetical protein Apa02nite_075230 [Actinoplanes palleronii]|uniref:Uncharacterized protein n=1 Tax=Actinoplanes palleronii TaxID=113570 RepID=A0ABQ4BLA4_9ACTN|nr:hypothetical protein Apa02nite_075230 [Actinoplanes palleronii]
MPSTAMNQGDGKGKPTSFHLQHIADPRPCGKARVVLHNPLINAMSSDNGGIQVRVVLATDDIEPMEMTA